MDSYQDVLITATEVKGYVEDESFSQALYGWHMVKKWGLPLSGGWAQQPKLFMDAIDAIEDAYNEWENEQMEKDKPKPGAPDLHVN